MPVINPTINSTSVYNNPMMGIVVGASAFCAVRFGYLNAQKSGSMYIRGGQLKNQNTNQTLDVVSPITGLKVGTVLITARISASQYTITWTGTSNPTPDTDGLYSICQLTASEHSVCEYRIYWGDLETSKGVFGHEMQENLYFLPYFRSLGYKCYIRIMADVPATTYGLKIPQWLYSNSSAEGGLAGTKTPSTCVPNELDTNAAGETIGVWYNVPDWYYGKGFMPNFGHAKVIAAHELLIKELAARYNDDPFIFRWSIGSVGHWGELHYNLAIRRRPSPSTADLMPFPSNEILNQYFDHYYDNFNPTLATLPFIAFRRGFQKQIDKHGGTYNDNITEVRQTRDWQDDYNLDSSAATYTDTNAVGMTNPSRWTQPKNVNLWLEEPVFSESASAWTNIFLDTASDTSVYSSSAHAADYAPGGTYNTNFKMFKHMLYISKCSGITIGYDMAYFSTSAINNGAYSLTRDNNFKEMKRYLGYRFAVKQVTAAALSAPAGTYSFEVIINNAGIAKFFLPWKLEISLCAGNTVVHSHKSSITADLFLVGDTTHTVDFTFPGTVPAGSYTICLAIVDDDDVPAINWANDVIEPVRTDKRLALGTFTVTATDTTPPPPPDPPPSNPGATLLASRTLVSRTLVSKTLAQRNLVDRGE